MAVALRNSPLFQDAALVSLWEMEGNSNDSKSSNNGTDTAITYNAANGKFQLGAGFNGTTSKIVIADSASLKIVGPLTMLAWIKTSTSSVTQPIFQSWSANTNWAGYDLYLDNNGKLNMIIGKNTGATVNTDYKSIVGGTAVNDGVFHLVTGVWDGTNLRLYLDGLPDASAVAAFNAAYAATNYIRIGTFNDSGTDVNFMNGALDDEAILSRALTAAEVLSYFNLSASIMNLTSKMW